MVNKTFHSNTNIFYLPYVLAKDYNQVPTAPSTVQEGPAHTATIVRCSYICSHNKCPHHHTKSCCPWIEKTLLTKGRAGHLLVLFVPFWIWSQSQIKTPIFALTISHRMALDLMGISQLPNETRNSHPHMPLFPNQSYQHSNWTRPCEALKNVDTVNQKDITPISTESTKQYLKPSGNSQVNNRYQQNASTSHFYQVTNTISPLASHCQ